MITRVHPFLSQASAEVLLHAFISATPGSLLFPKTVFEICCCKATTRTSGRTNIPVLFRFFLLIDGLHPLIYYALCLLPMHKRWHFPWSSVPHHVSLLSVVRGWESVCLRKCGYVWRVGAYEAFSLFYFFSFAFLLTVVKHFVLHFSCEVLYKGFDWFDWYVKKE